MTGLTLKSIIIIASLMISSHCRIIATQDKMNSKYLENISAMIEEIHHEEVMNEIDEHSSIIDDVQFEDIKHLEESLTYKTNMLKENVDLHDI